jgi:hypothetical protein
VYCGTERNNLPPLRFLAAPCRQSPVIWPSFKFLFISTIFHDLTISISSPGSHHDGNACSKALHRHVRNLKREWQLPLPYDVMFTIINLYFLDDKRALLKLTKICRSCADLHTIILPIHCHHLSPQEWGQLLGAFRGSP